MIETTVDIYHQARKIAYSCSAFQTEVKIFFFPKNILMKNLILE